VPRPITCSSSQRGVIRISRRSVIYQKQERVFNFITIRYSLQSTITNSWNNDSAFTCHLFSRVWEFMEAKQLTTE